MKTFLKRIKLVDHLTTDIEILKSEFVSKFRRHVDEGITGMFSDTFDIFSPSKNVYKGHVGMEGFKITDLINIPNDNRGVIAICTILISITLIR